MNKFLISEKYRLEIHWQKVIYEKDGLSRLEGCYLSGPVIKDVDQMNAPDSIKLDFTNQYRVFVPNFYIATLSWAGVEHKSDRIYLDTVLLKNKFLNSVPKLNDDDYLVVDTKNHEDEKHLYNYLYPTYLIKSSGERYNFNRG